MRRSPLLVAGVVLAACHEATAPARFVRPVRGPYVSVSAASNFTCGLTKDGSAYCWGSINAFSGSGGDYRVPLVVPGGLTFTSVSAGGGEGGGGFGEHACGLTTVAVVYCWGFAYGETPVAVSGATAFASISAGTFDCGVTGAGDAYCWDYRRMTPALVRGGLTFGSVSTRYYDACGLTTGGAAYCWRESAITWADSDLAPVPVSGGLTFASVSEGFTHTCGVTTDGAAYCWGDNLDGQLGTGSVNGGSNVPVPVSGGLTFASVSAGSTHSCGVTPAGVAYCWGEPGPELGAGSLRYCPVGCGRSPVPVAGGLTFAAVSAGAGHSCGVTTDGVLYCWGSNASGQLGVGSAAYNDYQDEPVPVAGQP